MANGSVRKVQEIAKDLKIPGKEIIERLKEHGVEVKSTSSQLSEEQLSLVLEIYTQSNDMGDEKLVKPPKPEAVQEEKHEEIKQPEQKQESAPKQQESKPAQKHENAKNENVQKQNVKSENAQKPDNAKNTPAPKQQENKPASNNQDDRRDKNRRDKNKKKAEKRNETHVAMQSGDGESIVVKTEENKRYVDTRMSSVELEKIDSREHMEELVPENVKYDGGRNKKKNKKKQQPVRQEKQEKPKKEQPEAPKITKIVIPDTITVGDLASKLGRGAAEIVKSLMMLGVMATITQSIDYDTASLIASEFDVETEKEVILTKEDILFMEEEDDEANLVPRPPVVVVMGHVDHGKTSLLDAIRDTSVTATEAGGITQHIGAYSVRLGERDITFLDTPGHEAFTTMRARGAQVTDIAILVVAADDGIMPQTVEAINHAKAAGVTIIVAINKIDKDGANPDRVKQMLVEHDLVPEEWGGDTVVVEISAKKRINIDGLLEMVLLVADMAELKANPDRSAKGTVIESQIDKGRGPVATVLVQNGTLHVGDTVIAGTAVGRVRAMINDKGRRVKTAGPSVPVEVLGLSEAPSGGDIFTVVKDEKLAREVAEQRKHEIKENRFNSTVKVSLDNLFSQIDEGNMKELNVIIKADVQGSVEAVKQSLEKLSNDEVRVKAIHGGVGAVNESDVMLANASNAIIVGFNVRPDAGAYAAAQQQEVDIRLYSVIYDAINEIEAAMKGMLDPEYREELLGHAEVRQVYKISGVGTIAGSYVTDGKIVRNAKIRIVRNGIVVHEGLIESLKRFKDDAKEVSENYECGMGIQNFNDVKEGDVIECYEMVEIER